MHHTEFTCFKAEFLFLQIWMIIVFFPLKGLHPNEQLCNLMMYTWPKHIQAPCTSGINTLHSAVFVFSNARQRCPWASTWQTFFFHYPETCNFKKWFYLPLDRCDRMLNRVIVDPPFNSFALNVWNLWVIFSLKKW